MRRFVLASATLLLAITMLTCSRNTAGLEQELKAAMEQRRLELQHGDADGYARLVADDLVLVDDDGNYRTKASVLKQIRDEGPQAFTQKISDLRVQVSGEIGFITYHVDKEDKFGSQSFKTESSELETYKRESSQWILISRAIVPLSYPHRTPAVIDPSVYDFYSGVYDFGDKFLVTIKRDGDNLSIFNSEDKTPQRLLPFSDMSFYQDKSTGVLTFFRDKKGKVVRLEVWDGDSTAKGTKID